MKKIRVNLIAYIVVFALMLALPIVTMNRIPGKISETEKRHLATFPTFFDGEGHLSGGLKNGFETWLGDNLGFRSEFMTIAANIKLKLFHQSTSEQVEIGRDGWYFYTPDSNLDIARGEYPNFDEGILQTICRLQEKVRDKLAAQGIEYVLILPPSKASIYPEYISSGEYTVTRTPVDILADYLEEHSDIKVIRLKDALLEAKENEQLYFKTDTHWNEYGAYISCVQIINDLRDWKITDGDIPQVTFGSGFHQGEFSAMLGNANLLGLEECPKSTIVDAKAERITDDDKYNSIMKAAKDANISNPVYHYENSKSNGPTALFFGDSMFGSWNATEMMAEVFSDFTYVWDCDIRQSIIDAAQPSVVFYEMTERYLNNLMLTKNLAFIKDQLADYGAEILDHTIGEDSIDVTVKNTSRSIWGYEDEVRLGIWSNGVDSGIRAYLPTDRVIMPGETVTFSFENIDTDDWLKNALEVQMLQEGIAYFGEREVIIESSYRCS